MDVGIDGNRLAERSVNGFELSIARFRRGCAPETLGTGMHERHRTMNLDSRQAAQPCESLFAKGFAGCRSHLPDRCPHGLQLGHLIRKLHQRLGHPKHFIRIANHALPTEIANAIHNFGGTCSTVRQVAAVEDQVGRGLSQIRQDCLKRGSVSVDVRHDCDAHHNSSMPGCATISSIPHRQTAAAAAIKLNPTATSHVLTHAETGIYSRRAGDAATVPACRPAGRLLACSTRLYETTEFQSVSEY